MVENDLQHVLVCARVRVLPALDEFRQVVVIVTDVLDQILVFVFKFEPLDS